MGWHNLPIGSFKVAIIYTIMMFIIYLIIFSVVNNEIKNATINGNFSIKDHQWLLIFQRPFFFSFLCSLIVRLFLLEFISFVASTLCVAFTLLACRHFHPPTCFVSPAPKSLTHLPVVFIHNYY